MNSGSTTFFRITRVSAIAALFAAVGSNVQAGIINDYNLVVTGNLYSNSEVEGRTFVGGNLTGPASNYGIGFHPKKDYVDLDVLEVAGNIDVSNVNMKAGSIRLGGKMTGKANFSGGGALVNDPSMPSEVFAVAAGLTSFSNYLATLDSNSTVKLPGSQPAPASFIATPGGPDNLAIFNISASDVFSNGRVQQIGLTANGASSIIVNVSGKNVNFNSGNFVGAWQSDAIRAITIWNFYEATTINLDRQFNGAILAPLASLTNSTAIEGSVFVNSFNMRGEVHTPNYTGYTPEPATLALLSFAMIMTKRRTNRTNRGSAPKRA